ncbi:MAG: hypothetical protein ACYC8T_04580 [Myxococcaceae bacterium]
MKKLALLAVVAIAAGCTPKLDKDPPPEQVQARFNPAASPPVVPSPNSLAIDPQTGKVSAPLPPDPSDADRQFVAYLNTLDGFPADSPGQASFDGELSVDSVTSDTVRVMDLTDGMKPVVGYIPAKASPPPGAGGGMLVSPPASGWTAGHDLLVVLVGGDNGIKGAAGQPVVGSNVWALVRARNPLVTCSGPSPSDCRATTPLLSAQEAVQLERLRQLYKPLFDALEAGGLPREDIPLLWTFKVASEAGMAFQPTATPPAVPVPNDLAIDPATGRLNIPVDPRSSPANQAFVSDYLNTLNGFPPTTPGSAAVVGGTLSPASVNAQTVQVIDLTPASGGGAAIGPVSAPIGFDGASRTITIDPPGGAWTRGHHYAVVVVGGPNGVRTPSGGQVFASTVWALVRSTAPLATCADPANADCTSLLGVVSLTDAEAARLERLRQAFQPLLDSFAARGVARENIPVAWTFTIFSQPEAVFDPANQVLPFPNDLLRETPSDGGTPHVNLPVPPGASEQVQALNTLDGFSTTAPAVSENSDGLAPLTGGARIDPASLAGGTGFVLLQPSGDPTVLQTEPQVSACLSCASSLLADGGTQVGAGRPEQLQFVPAVPLDEKTSYAAFLTTDLKAQGGLNVVASPTFVLLRSPAPLVDSSGHSTISGVSDAQAAQAEPLRQALKPLFDALDAQGHPRKQLALAWSFTTESTVTQLARLHGFPAAATLPDKPMALAAAPGVTPSANASAVFAGEMPEAFLLTGPSGTLNPVAPKVDRIPFLLVLPKTAPPGSGYPVVVFGHGLRGARGDALALSDALAQAGIATIAIDEVWHGERTSCTGSAATLRAAGLAGATDDFACGGPGAAPNPATQACDEGVPIGRCIGRNGGARTCTFGSPTAADVTGGDLFCMSVQQGRCQSSGRCEGGDFWRTGAQSGPVISGWNTIDPANLFTTRDNLRQQVVDFSQLTRLIRGTGDGSLNALLTGAGASGTLDGDQIHYVGLSLAGALFNAVSPQTHRVVLNVPAGNLPGILLTTQSPELVAGREAFLAGLAAQGITVGTPAFDSFIGFAHWILDPSDPVNAGAYLARGNYIPGDRQAFIQFIEGDQTLPNPTTQALVAATLRPPQMSCASGQAPPCADVFAFTVDVFSSVMPAPEDRHGFLLNGVTDITSYGQNQVTQYLTQGTVKTTFP